MVWVGENFKIVLNEMIYATDIKHVTMLEMENVNHIYDNVNTSIAELENRWNVYLTSNDTWMSRAKPSCNS